MKIRIATRKSPLALFQAEYVANQIKQLDQKIRAELIPMSSEGDLTDKPLHQIGGKGLFIKTLESHGLPMKNVYVERAGNMSGSSAENKQVIFRKYLKTGEYARIRLFDDHKENLQALLDLKREFPTVEMFAYLADLKGSVKRII